MLFLFSLCKTFSQEDTKEKKPYIAALLSIIPGGGQIYNGQLWKVPIFASLIAITSYSAYYNYQKFQEAKKLYIQNFDTNNTPESFLNKALIFENMMHYRRWFEVSIILSAMAYAVNIGDAYTQAHLHLFKKIEKEEVSISLSGSIITFAINF